MNFWRSMAGVMEVELISAAPEEALREINRADMEIRCLEALDDLTCRFQISRQDYPRVKKLTDKRGETLRYLQGKGLYWKGKALRSRRIYVFGLCMILGLTLLLPTKILLVSVSGNERIPSRQILAAAEEAGICFGADRSEVRSEKVKNALLSKIPELQWVGINTSGCLATVSVRERAQPQEAQGDRAVSRIVAARDGFILRSTVTQGTPLFQVGQAVKEGEVLVSGYTDCGICIRATRSVGEIFAQTQRDFQAVTPTECGKIRPVGKVRYKISLRVRKKRINLWKDSGISPSTCGRMYQEYCLRLPGGFQLPVALCLEAFPGYAVEKSVVSRELAQQSLTHFADASLKAQMAAGEILERSEQVTVSHGTYQLQGQYTCVEMIGREQPEKIGEPDGKNS